MLTTALFVPLIFTLTLLFPSLSHPLAIGVSLLLLTILAGVLVGRLASSIWITYTLILVLLGGLLVIFIYVALLASNELFIPRRKTFIITISSFALSSMLTFVWAPSALNLHSYGNFEIQVDNLEWINDLYSSKLSRMTVFLIVYLLLTLIVVVNNLKNNYSSLQSA